MPGRYLRQMDTPSFAQGQSRTTGRSRATAAMGLIPLGRPEAHREPSHMEATTASTSRRLRQVLGPTAGRLAAEVVAHKFRFRSPMPGLAALAALEGPALEGLVEA